MRVVQAFRLRKSFRCQGSPLACSQAASKGGAQFSPPNAANRHVVLTFDGSGPRIILPQARSAAGGRYAGDGFVFWIKGKTATLTRSGASENCTTD